MLLKIKQKPYLLFASSMFFFLSCSNQSPSCNCIPDDRGPLIIKSGSTVTLESGKTYFYESILIHKGGTLEFSGVDSARWTIIKTRGNFRLEGTIRSRGFSNKQLDRIPLNPKRLLDSCSIVPSKSNTTFNMIPFHTYPKWSAGGDGGSGGRMTECSQHSPFMLECLMGKDGICGNGGTGGNGMSLDQMNLCRANNTKCNECYLVINKEDRNRISTTEIAKCLPCSASSSITKSGALSIGKGGEGGGTGNFGGLIYIESCKNFFGENGTIDVSGGHGGDGEAGESNKFSGGGGGGGGPGGNGGALYFNVRGNLSLPTVNIEGGVGGSGGAGGAPHIKDGLLSLKGSNGQKGSKGKRGKLIICQDDCFNLKQ